MCRVVISPAGRFAERAAEDLLPFVAVLDPDLDSEAFSNFDKTQRYGCLLLLLLQVNPSFAALLLVR